MDQYSSYDKQKKTQKVNKKLRKIEYSMQENTEVDRIAKLAGLKK